MSKRFRGLVYGSLTWVALRHGFETFIQANVKNSFWLYTLVFTLTLVDLVHIMHHSGETLRLARLLFGAANNARSNRLDIAGMGEFFF